jgi:hypothetical protein
MITLQLSNIVIEDGVTWLATDWEVSSTLQFNVEDLIAESIDDSENKESISFNNVLDPEQVYYARAQLKLSSGYTEVSNIYTFKPEDLEEQVIEMNLPSLISTPIISTDSEQLNHSPTMFNILISGYRSELDTVNSKISLVIEDADKNVIYSHMYDEIEKNKISIYDLVLEENKIYRIKASFHSNQGMISSVSSYTIRVGSNNDIIYDNDVYNINSNEDMYIRLFPFGEKILKTELFVSSLNGYNKINSMDVNENIFTVSKDLLVTNELYLLKAWFDGEDDYSYLVFST